MVATFTLAAIIVALAAIAFKYPFLRFPMDEDFSFYTYLAHFQGIGLQMKKDFMVLSPVWRARFISLVYGKSSANGVFRIRLFLMLAHVATSLTVFWAAYVLTQDIWAAFTAGILYAILATVPSLSVHTINMEQIYLGLVISGLVLLLQGRYVEAGFLFGLAVVPKIASGIYVPPLALVVWHIHGFTAGLLFCAIAALPSALSYAFDFLCGYADAESMRQFSVRWAVGVRLGKLKGMYGSVAADIKAVATETMPAWAIGTPALFLIPFHAQWLLLTLFVAMSLAMVYFQMAFSRYHYLPLVAILCVSSGAGLSVAPEPVKAIAIAALVATAAFSAWKLWPMYLFPTQTSSLAKYEKFDQYIYIPRLGKALGRLMRMKKEDCRIFVWGNYTQIYHYANAPAADTFLHYAVGPWDNMRMTAYYDTVIGGLMRHKPLYLVKVFRDFDMELLKRVTGLEYRLLKVALGRFAIYRLAGSKTPGQDPRTLDWQQKMEIFAQLSTGEHAPGINTADLDAGKLRQAIKECRKLVRLNPHDAEGLFFLDRLYEQAGTDGDLDRLFEELLKERPEQKNARLVMAKRKMRKGHYPEAYALVAEEKRIFGESAETQFMEGLLLRATGYAKNAAMQFGKLHAEEPENGEYAYYLAECMLASGETREAKKMYDTAWQKSNGQQQEWVRTQTAVRLALIGAETTPEHETLGNFAAMYPQSEMLAYARASALEKAGMHDAARSAFKSIAVGGRMDNVKGAAMFRLARMAGGNDGGDRISLLRNCLKLLPNHRGAKKLLEGGGNIG